MAEDFAVAVVILVEITAGLHFRSTLRSSHGRRSTERRHPDAQVGQGEAMQVPRPATRYLLGLRAPHRGELALEAQPRELLNHAPADRVGDLVAARAEDVD